MKSVMSDGTFLAIRMAVIKGTISRTSDKSKVLSSELEKEAICYALLLSCMNPAMAKMMREINIEGVVVNIM